MLLKLAKMVDFVKFSILESTSETKALSMFHCRQDHELNIQNKKVKKSKLGRGQILMLRLSLALEKLCGK